MWFGADYPADRPTEVQVRGPDNVDLVYGWHESGPLRPAHSEGMWASADAIAFGCLAVDGAQLSLQLTDKANPQAFIYVEPVTGSDAGPTYFSILFKGCFRADDGGSWCFAPGQLRLSEGVRRAELILDASEAPGPGSVLRVEGDRMLWVFLPRGTGWAVFRSDWASAESYIEPDWNKPWRILTPRSMKKNAPKRP
jgi:hypothetical protein